MARLPLQGLRVLEITVVWAGPYCGSFLADLGAEVIRVESTKTFVPLTRGAAPHLTQAVIDNLPLYSGGTPGRVPGERPFNRSPMFNSHARNKRSMTVNLPDPGGREIFDRLVAVSDVLVENNPTETMEKLGISYDSLKAVKDDIIMLRMPAYGSTGPYRDYRAHGVHIEGVVGHTMLRGYEDTDPSYNTTVLMSGRRGRGAGRFRRAGRVASSEAHRGRPVGGTWPGRKRFSVPRRILHGLPDERGERTVRREIVIPWALQNCYPCAGENRWVVITVYDDRQWAAFCEAIDTADLATDKGLSQRATRRERQDEIDVRITEWTRQRDPDEIMHQLQRRGIPAGVVMNQARCVWCDPHIQSRGFFQEASQEDCGTHLYPGPLYKLSETPLSIRRGSCDVRPGQRVRLSRIARILGCGVCGIRGRRAPSGQITPKEWVKSVARSGVTPPPYPLQNWRSDGTIGSIPFEVRTMPDKRIGIHAGAPNAGASLDLTRRAEAAGVQATWLTTGGTGLDALTLFSAAAVQTDNILFGTSIVPTYPRHPIVVAQQAQVIDQLAPGRLRIGVGPSHRPPMRAMFGFELRAPLTNLREYLQILRALLQEGSVDFDGQEYTAHASIPRPLNVPVMASALQEGIFRVVWGRGRWCDQLGQPGGISQGQGPAGDEKGIGSGRS